jgi:DNA-binding response OmpR family regulator
MIRMRILLIEDDRIIGRSLSTALAREGMSVDWARNASEGEEALAIGNAVDVLIHSIRRRFDHAVRKKRH